MYSVIFSVLMYAGPHDAGDDVPAHEAGNARERIQVAVPAHLDTRAEVHGADGWDEIGRRHVGSQAQVLGVDPHEQAGHGGVPGGHHVADHAALHTARPHEFVQHLVDGAHDDVLQLFAVLQALLCIHYPADDVFAEQYLPVVRGGLGHHGALPEVQELTPDRGGADVQHHRVVLFRSVARLQVDDFVAIGGVDHRGRHEPVLLAEDAGHVADPDGVHGDVGEPELVLQTLLEPGQIVEAVSLGWWLELHAVLLHHRIEGPPGDQGLQLGRREQPALAFAPTRSPARDVRRCPCGTTRG